jgi:hypothetical protein
MGFFKDLFRLFDRISNPDEYKDVGLMGERFTFNELKNIFSERQIILNVYVKKKNDELTEIDMVIVCRKGILVIESKNYSGWIFGNENDSNWTQTFKSGIKQSFFNPVIQNQVHINALMHNLSDFPNAPFFSIIVFSERCELKNVTVTDKNTLVVQRQYLNFYLKKLLRIYPEVLTDEERDNIIKRLSIFSRPDESIKQEHIQQLQNNTLKCPKCRSTLVERTAKHTGNKFMGCENFPKCRYTKNL